jgi:hypothetical protein
MAGPGHNGSNGSNGANGSGGALATRGRLRIVSHFPGRLRVRAEAFRDRERGDAAAEALRGEDGVLTADATPLTGSLLVTYEARRVQLPWLVQLIVRIANLDGIEADHDGKPYTPGGPAIREALDKVNDRLIAATRGRVDSKTAVPTTLFGLGALTILLGRFRPPEWYDWMFWSFVTFMNLNPAPSPQPQTDDGAAD